MKNAKMRTGIILGVIVLLVLIVGAGAVTVVPAGHTGVVVTMGKVSDRVLDEGMHFKMPFVQQVVMMNNKIQKTEIDSNGVSKDLQTVSSGVAINYHINKDDSAVIYRTIGEGYADGDPGIHESHHGAVYRRGTDYQALCRGRGDRRNTGGKGAGIRHFD